MTEYTTFEHDVLVIGAGGSADTLVRIAGSSGERWLVGSTCFSRRSDAHADRSFRAPFNG